MKSFSRYVTDPAVSAPPHFITPALVPRPTITLDTSQDPDYYGLLSVSSTASFTEIKSAYHRALLQFHPDKQRLNEAHTRPSSDNVDVDLLRRAYTTLYAHESRSNYDALRNRAPSGPRPAQVISLEDFAEVEESAEDGVWTYKCRCGGVYRIKESEMECGQHLVGCSGCSEVVWVGFELAEDAL